MLHETLLPVAELHAYNYLPNHFHLLVRAKDDMETGAFSKEMNRLQSRYAKGFNYTYERKGSLFMSPYNRIPITNTEQLIWVFWYIHRNPLHHGITQKWKEYPYSSFLHYKSKTDEWLSTEYLLALFGSWEQLNKHHEQLADMFKSEHSKLTLE